MLYRAFTFGLVLTFLPIVASAQHGVSLRPVVIPTATVQVPAWEGSFDDMLERIAVLRGIAKGQKDRGLRKQMLTELDALRGSVREMKDYLRASSPTAPGALGVTVVTATPGGGIVAVIEEPPPGPYEDPYDQGPQAMTEADFGDLLASMNKHGFADEKLRVVREVVSTNSFTVAQVQRILNDFSFGKDRIAALETLAGSIVDLENNYRIYESFTFDSEKEKVRRILSRVTR